AIEGRLVPTEAELARAEGRSYESGDQLLARILIERRKRWEAHERSTSCYSEPNSVDPADLPILPDGWAWATAEQLCDQTRALTYGVIKLGEPVEGGVPILRSSNVRRLRLDL